MRRGGAVLATVVGVLIVIAVGIGAYNWGLDEGVRRGADAGQVVEVVGRGWHDGPGFFPFGLLLFPLLIIGVVWLIASAFRGPGHDHPNGPWGGPGRFGPWSEEGRARFEEWHRRQHGPGTPSGAQSSPPTPGEPASG